MKPRTSLLAVAPFLLVMFGCAPRRPVTVRLVGGPTAVIELGGARFLTDPTFSAPGPYQAAPGRFLTKTEGPAATPEQIGPIDAVLLSHDQHADNLDPAGRAFVAAAPTTFSTPLAAERLPGHVIGLAPWQTVTFVAKNGRRFRITGAPAQHGPDDTESVTGPVTGFIVTSEGLPTVYVSGDNASVEHVRAIAARVHVDVAVLFAGAAKSPKLLGDALLTLDAQRAAEAARLLADATIVPVHFRGWGHFTESDDALRRAFAGTAADSRLVLLRPGETTRIQVPRRP
jgi:L-ascorbate metabolism protein UlaG (beta-lactamase superfamily)